MLSSVSSINRGLCLIFIISLTGCGGGDESVPNGALSNGPSTGVGAPTPLVPRCDATASGTSTVEKPELLTKLADRYHEGWLASPAVADLNGDGTNEIIILRAERVETYGPKGNLLWT